MPIFHSFKGLWCKTAKRYPTLKTIPCSATHTRLGQIRGCLPPNPPPPPSRPRRRPSRYGVYGPGAHNMGHNLLNWSFSDEHLRPRLSISWHGSSFPREKHFIFIISKFNDLFGGYLHNHYNVLKITRLILTTFRIFRKWTKFRAVLAVFDQSTVHETWQQSSVFVQPAH